MYNAGEIIRPQHVANRYDNHAFGKLFRIPYFQVDLSDAAFVHKLIAFGTQDQAEPGA